MQVLMIGQAGGADLVAVLVGLELGRRVLGDDRRALDRDDRLLHRVVARRRTSPPGHAAGVNDTSLMSKSNGLGPRRVDAVERLVHPGHLGLAEAELSSDRVGDRALVALAVGRGVVHEPGRERPGCRSRSVSTPGLKQQMAEPGSWCSWSSTCSCVPPDPLGRCEVDEAPARGQASRHRDCRSRHRKRRIEPTPPCHRPVTRPAPPAYFPS